MQGSSVRSGLSKLRNRIDEKIKELDVKTRKLLIKADSDSKMNSIYR